MLEQIVEPLLQWFDENKRIVPWRRTLRHIMYGYQKLCCSRPG